MADQPEVSEGDDNARDLRGKLIARLAVAGVLVALLLGVLAFFDYLANPPDEAEQRVFTQPVPVAPKKEVSQPVTPAENLPEPPAPEKTEPPVEPPPPPKVEASQPAVVEAKPEPRPESHAGAKSSAANVKPVLPAPPAPPAPLPPAVPEATTAPSNTLAPQRPAAQPEAAPTRPSVRIVEAKPAPTPAPVLAPPSAPRLFSGFLLQAGVFSSIQRAEELHARLTLSGVPSTLETRVQVGPFRTRHEAELAQAKLKELGVEAILVPPKGKN